MGYLTALSRHRKRQYTLVFDGFQSPTGGYQNPTISKLAKVPAETYYKSSNAHSLITQLATDKLHKVLQH